MFGHVFSAGRTSFLDSTVIMSAKFTEGQNELNDPEVDREPTFRPTRWGRCTQMQQMQFSNDTRRKNRTVLDVVLSLVEICAKTGPSLL